MDEWLNGGMTTMTTTATTMMFFGAKYAYDEHIDASCLTGAGLETGSGNGCCNSIVFWFSVFWLVSV